MRITDVRVIVLESPIDYGLDTGGGDSAGPKRSCIFVVDTDNGISGVSQIESQPGVARAIVDAPGEASGFFSGLRSLAIGQDPLQVEALWQRLYIGSFYFGRHGAALQAISGIDIACWDIMGKYFGAPIATLLGGKRRDNVDAYASTLFRESVPEVKDAAARYVESGFKAVKFGWGVFGEDPERDVAMVAAAREVLGPERRLMVDSGWRRRRTAKEAIKMVRSIAEFDPYWVEEPCFPEDYATLGRLCEAVEVQIAAGEAEDTTSGFRRLIDAGVDVLQPDLSRCGGFTVARRVAYAAEEANVAVCPHAWGSQILAAATLQYLAFLPQDSMLEFNTSTDPISRSLLSQPLTLKGGQVAVPNRPGLGVEVDMDVITELAGERQ